MGKWTAYHALRNKGREKESKYLETLTPIYLQQDIYCVSSEQGLPLWPSRAIDRDHDSLQGNEEGNGFVEGIKNKIQAEEKERERKEEKDKAERLELEERMMREKIESIRHANLEVEVEGGATQEREEKGERREEMVGEEREERPSTPERADSTALSVAMDKESEKEEERKGSPLTIEDLHREVK